MPFRISTVPALPESDRRASSRLRIVSFIGCAFRRLVHSPYGAAARLSKTALTVLCLSLPASADPATVLAFGDSLTAGYGLEQGAGFVPQLEAWLNAHGADVVVVNAGLSGDTTAGGAARIAWSLTDDIDAVIVALGGNDLLRGIDPGQTRANLDTVLTTIDARDLPVLLIGQRAIGNFGADYATAFEAVYPALAQAHGSGLYPNFLLALENLGDRDRVLHDFMQHDAIHPNAAGVALIVADIGPVLLDLIENDD